MEDGQPIDQLDNIIIVDGLPVVPPEKYDKLHALIKKISNSFGCVTQRFELPKDEKDFTTGFAFVEYQSKAEAERAITKMHGQSLDKKHVFAVCLFTDWLKFKYLLCLPACGGHSVAFVAFIDPL